MTIKHRSVLMSVVTLVLSLSLAAGGTYALFSDGVTLTTHLQAGTLDITLTRTHLTTVLLDGETGLLVKTQDESDVDFSDPSEQNVFGISDETRLVPGCSYAAELQITNNADVAFGYWLEIVIDDAKGLDLADQLSVTVITANGKAESPLNACLGLIGTQTQPIGVLAKTESETFTVCVAFLDLGGEQNNAAKSQNLHFDVVVHAVHSTTAPTT